MFLGSSYVYDDVFGSGNGFALFYDTVGNDGIADEAYFFSDWGPQYDYTLFF